MSGLWGGRFEDDPDPLFRRLNDSLPFDRHLVEHDIAGSQAWARALGDAGVLDGEETRRLVAGLQTLADEVRDDPAALREAGDEDVHSWVERRLIESIGDLGRKLHTGRSRNDQVATDLRLWVRAAIAERRRELRAAQAALVALGQRSAGVVLPGYTHRQRAQPVLFGHWCLAFVEMLRRDDTRLIDAARRADECPLGSAALAGTSFPIDRMRLAAALGFRAPTANSLDAVSDRDFIIETIGVASLCASHLSRLADDLIFFASGEADFIELDDTMTSGSSLMPQKKNPDALELVRAKAGALLGHLTAVSCIQKGLPLAYNKDLQELTPPLFAAMDDLELCLKAVPRVLQGIRVKSERTRRAAEGGYANATELADYLVGRGIPFRTAHDLVGQIVRHAIERGEPLEALPLEELRTLAPAIEADVSERLTLETLLARRDVLGGTAPAQVDRAMTAAAAEFAVGG
ncbi:MAG: argininosuccinate lyase [Phycisphaerales bacterium]|nr:argininosuccinate lyase [Phycisphaerales bacterium]